MKLHTRPTRSHVLQAGVVILTFCFLLLLSQGFVTSGDDWYFSSRTMDEDLGEALLAGYHSARGHYFSTNGRLLGNALSKALGCSEFWREFARCGIILTILLQLCRMARIRDLTGYALALMLTVALPADIYAQSYVWAAGFFNYVPPLLMILGYIFRIERLFDGGRDGVAFGVGMFCLGFAAQLFVENVTVGMCLFSAGVMIWYLVANRKLSWSMCGHLLGAIVGCVVMFAAPGYANINEEGYRQVSATFAEMMKVVQNNFGYITMYLTERNWLNIVPLTALSICLLIGARPEKNWQRIVRTGALLCLTVCPVYFYAHYELLRGISYALWVAQIGFWLDIAANLLYLLAVLAAVVLGMDDPVRKRRAVLCIAAVPMIFGPLVVVTPIGPRCLYIPYMLLVCLVLILGADVLDRCKKEQLRAVRVPLAAAVVCVLTVYLWVAVWNGHCEDVRIRQIETAMANNAPSAELPNYPYMSFVHNANGGAVRYYYYYETPGDLEFRYIDHSTWYQS